MSGKEGALNHESLDVVVIGGGWSGILATKYARDYGLSVRTYEARPDLGGVWCYTEDPETVSVAQYTRTSSSSLVTEASDYAMPEEWGPFPTHRQVWTYLNGYVDHFGLRESIKTNTRVQTTEKTDHGWRVATTAGVVECRHLIVTTGTHAKRNDTLPEPWSRFTGHTVHVDEVKTQKSLLDAVQGQRVLILGGGETAADIVEVLVSRGQQVCLDWSIPNGQRFFRKYVAPFPHLATLPRLADEGSSLAFERLIPNATGRMGISMMGRWTTSGSFVGYQGHDVPEWWTESEGFHSAFNKNGAVLEHVFSGSVGAKRKAVKVSGRRVEFDEGTSGAYDLVIKCLGYRPAEFAFLPETHQTTVCRCWRFIFHPDDPSLMFLGFARPILGSIPLMTEAQCKLVFRVLTGKATLPPDLRQRALEDRQRWRDYFKDTSLRVSTLVEPFMYLKHLMKDGGFEPDPLELLRSHPTDWLYAFLGPPSAALIHLDEPGPKRTQALKKLKQGFSWWMPPSLAIAMCFRLLGVDAALIKAGEWRHHHERRHPNSRLNRAYKAARGFSIRHIINRSTFTGAPLPHFTAVVQDAD